MIKFYYVHTVNPLLSPPGGLFFSSTFEGGLNREGGLINFPPLKRGGLLERGGLNRGFMVTILDNMAFSQSSVGM